MRNAGEGFAGKVMARGNGRSRGRGMGGNQGGNDKFDGTGRLGGRWRWCEMGADEKIGRKVGGDSMETAGSAVENGKQLFVRSDVLQGNYGEVINGGLGGSGAVLFFFWV
ncbi:unnamed protein product [Calypogeia fissa]